MRPMRAALVLAVATAGWQAQQPVIRSRVTMVPLDVRVVDRDGRPITGLVASDFTVTEDGTPQTIAHFSAQGLTPEPHAAGAPMELASAGPGDGPPGPQNRRVFLVVLSRGRHQAFRHGDALAQFLGKGLMPQDVVALTAWNRATDFTTDHARMSEVAQRYARRHERIEVLIREWYQGIRGQLPNRGRIPPHIQQEIDWVFEPADGAASVPVSGGNPGFAEFMRRSVPVDKRFDITRMLVGLNYLRFFSGEKRLVWFSEFASGLPRPAAGGGIAAMASANRIAIDVIQTGGTLGAAPAGFSGPMSNRRISMPIMPSSAEVSRFMWRLQDARETAAATGGLASTLKKGPEAFAALSAVTSHGYSLGYYPTNATPDEKYREIRVTVNRPGARVLSRSGYYASARVEPLDLRDYTTAERVRQAITGGDPEQEIGVTVTKVTREAGELLASVRLDLRGIIPGEEQGMRIASLELAASATGERREVAGEVRQRLDLKLLPANWDKVIADGMELTVRLTVKGRARSLSVVAYHYASDAIGSARVTLDGR